MRYIKTLLIICLSISFAKAQLIADNRRVADVYFLNKEYYAAAEYYKKVLQISSDSTGFVVPYGFEKRIKEENPKKEDYEYAVFQLATSLRLYKNFQDAEKWYAIAREFTNPKYATSGFHYGECLRANFKFDEAITAYQTFMAKYSGQDYQQRAKMEIESCKFAIAEIKYPRRYKLNKLAPGVNLAGSNYGTALSDKTFYFTSSRPKNVDSKDEVLTGANNNRVVKKATPYLNAIYTANGDPNATKIDVDKIDFDIKQMEAAAPTIHPNGNIMYFTAWINKGDRKRSIYTAKKGSNNKWSDPVPLGGEINVLGFNSMQPFVSKDGKHLIFSSDRPGGSGKYDLWYAVLRTDGTTGNATNLGNRINTQGDDEAPYFNPKTKKMLFSSNGRPGMGGLDFYETEGDFATWTAPKNLGYPFNSPKDDIYFTSLDDDDQHGYISSDRESICCLEIFNIKKELLYINGTILDCKTMKPLEGATVTISGQDMEEQTVISDKNGSYRFGIGSNRGFQVTATKDLYFAKKISYGYEQLASVDTLQSSALCLTPFVIDKPIVIKNVFYEFDSADLTDSSKAVLNNLVDLMNDNKNIEIELGSHTDNIGTAEYNKDLSERRAKSCVDYLISMGIPATRMTSKGYGFMLPIAPNKLKNGDDHPEGRALNRRTEFKVTKK